MAIDTDRGRFQFTGCPEKPDLVLVFYRPTLASYSAPEVKRQRCNEEYSYKRPISPDMAYQPHLINRDNVLNLKSACPSSPLLSGELDGLIYLGSAMWADLAGGNTVMKRSFKTEDLNKAKNKSTPYEETEIELEFSTERRP